MVKGPTSRHSKKLEEFCRSATATRTLTGGETEGRKGRWRVLTVPANVVAVAV